MKPCYYCTHLVDTTQSDTSWAYAIEDECNVHYVHMECLEMDGLILNESGVFSDKSSQNGLE